ncbi:MAG: nuclear transport factor 2 family protein [Rubrivivax sp.]|nr:nuclear transport factor 2 family protein [Rubrivivax sp.]
MQACYADDARFDDEVFSLRGAREIGAMWSMLCANVRASEAARAAWRLDTHDLADDRVRWEVHYLFGPQARPVHNVIDARFEFDAAGRITRHRDRFDFRRWSRQALGLPGWLLGGTPWLRAKVRAQAARTLQRHLANTA